MKYLVLLLAVTAVSFGYISHGPHVKVWLPTGDMGDAYNTSFGIHYQAMYHMPVVAIEGTIGYVFLSTEIDEMDASLIPISLGIRSYSGSMYAAGGLEYDHIKWSMGDLDDSNGEIGGFFGAGMVNRMGFGKLDIGVRAHWMDFDEFMISLGAGLIF
jgi:hypothetical protein